ncbi:HesA/MoeB/ThiF family protein [Sphingomonas abaci]|uniref:Adenylyltransferase/sulfurtransferase n=1 Tax=Sphingomonas abaci TaxID=237611 RepID=A0A7W7AH57_9SPHN|nr:molybdopterin-synthase adenylyltransferase MoeB [Sphingomonas abaci]MBB4616781.1 adenylyltransferase/sulfurtransferase [Sphingomonas abaci]
MLSDLELERYARHIVLHAIGGSGQIRLREATVVLVGVGGIGSPALQYLAAAGIGRIVAVDDDVVDLSNLQRQTIFSTDDRGYAKALAGAARARAINPHVEILPHRLRLDSRNIAATIAGADAVLDGCDNFATRLLVADACHQARIPLVSAAVDQFEGQLATYRGWEAGRPCYRCFVGDSPERPGRSCADAGILGPVTGVIGSLAALEVIRVIAPFGDDPAGTVLLADLLSLRFRSVRLPKDPGCTTCGGAQTSA